MWDLQTLCHHPLSVVVECPLCVFIYVKPLPIGVPYETLTFHVIFQGYFSSRAIGRRDLLERTVMGGRGLQEGVQMGGRGSQERV